MKVKISKMVHNFALPFDRFDDPRVFGLFGLIWPCFGPHDLDWHILIFLDYEWYFWLKN